MLDIAMDGHNTFKVVNGDFAIAESTEEHGYQLVQNDKCDFKDNPTVCVGAINYLDDDGYNALLDAIAIEFRRDGMSGVNVTRASNGIVDVKGAY